MELLGGKLDTNQGAENAGKILGIGADGQVVPMDAPEGGGGGGGGGLIVEDDGNGNVSIVSTGGVSITDDGNGNVIIA